MLQSLKQNLPGLYIYRETLNLKYSKFISYLSPICVQLALMWYSILLSLQFFTRNFERLLFCEIIPTFCHIGLRENRSAIYNSHSNWKTRPTQYKEILNIPAM